MFRLLWNARFKLASVIAPATEATADRQGGEIPLAMLAWLRAAGGVVPKIRARPPDIMYLNRAAPTVMALGVIASTVCITEKMSPLNPFVMQQNTDHQFRRQETRSVKVVVVP